MNYIDGKTYWKSKTQIKNTYPYLTYDTYCDVLIIGGGITGAITAYFLAKEGVNVIIAEKNIVRYDSTLASTAFLDYEASNDILKLEKTVGKTSASKIYKLCDDAINKIEEISVVINSSDSLKRQDMIYYTNKLFQKSYIKKECEKRRELGIDTDYIDYHKFVNLNGGIIAKDKTIVLNPYEFTQKLIRYLYDLPNVRIYENTNIVDVNPGAIDGVEAKTNNDFLILASNVIFSSGFETLKYMDKTPVELYRNFTIVSGKKDELKNLDHKFVAKDMQEPCHYIRFTDTGRVICSGEDVKLTDKFNDTKYLNNVAKDKYKKLYSYIQKTLPMSQNLSVDYAFNSIIADTKDNLPIIDEMPGMPNCFCNLGFGVNGILYSAIGGNILKDAIKGFYTKDMNLFKIIR